MTIFKRKVIGKIPVCPCGNNSESGECNTASALEQIRKPASNVIPATRPSKDKSKLIRRVVGKLPNPSVEQVQSDWNQSDNTKPDFIKHKPTIPAEQIQSDWSETDSDKKSFIKNKPTIPEEVTVDTALSKTSTNPVQNKVIAEALEKAGNIDKSYDPTKHSGLGKKFIPLKSDGSNILTQEDFDQENTIYIVQYDFDLNGQTITIPEGCLLEFNGGSLSNGKILSNKTLISGEYQNSVDSFIGGFYYNDKIIGFNKSALGDLQAYDCYGNFNTDILFGLVNDTNFVWNASQAIVVTDDYFLVFANNSSEKTVCVLYDRAFNYLGYSYTTQICHSNDATIVDGYLLLSITVRNNPGIAKVLLSTVINSCLSENDKTFDFEIINTNIGINYCVDYDSITNTIFTYSSTLVNILDTNYNIIRSFNTNILQNIIDKFGREMTIQGCCFCGGIAYIAFWDRINNEHKALSCGNVIVVYDTYNDYIVDYKYIIGNGYSYEIEGLFLYNGHLFTTFNSHSENAGMGFSISEITDKLPLYTNLLKVNSNFSTLRANGSTYTLYVDNTYTGISSGSQKAPFKRISEAIYSAQNKAQRTNILLANSETPYYCYQLIWRGADLTITGNKNGGQEIDATFRIQSGFCTFQNVILSPTDRNNINEVLYIEQSCQVRYIAPFAINLPPTTMNSCIRVYYGGKFWGTGKLILNDSYYTGTVTPGTFPNGIRVGVISIHNSNVYIPEVRCTNLALFLVTGLDVNIYLHYATMELINSVFAYSPDNSLIFTPYSITLGYIDIASEDTRTALLNFAKLCFINNQVIFTSSANVTINDNVIKQGEFVIIDKSIRYKANPWMINFAACVCKDDNRPNLGNYGAQVFNRTFAKPMFRLYDNNTWVDANGHSVLPTKGTTSERPTTLKAAYDIGFEYFDTTLGKPIYAKTISGSTVTWVDATGATV